MDGWLRLKFGQTKGAAGYPDCARFAACGVSGRSWAGPLL